MEQRDRLRELLEGLSSRPDLKLGVEGETTLGMLAQSWVPRTRNPEELYSVYCGHHDVSRAALKTMQDELRGMGVVSGMSEREFRAWIAATINQTLLVARVIERINTKGQVTEKMVKEILSEIGVDDVSRPREVLEILERWLTHFLPSEFETVQDSIRLIKAKKV